MKYSSRYLPSVYNRVGFDPMVSREGYHKGFATGTGLHIRDNCPLPLGEGARGHEFEGAATRRLKQYLDAFIDRFPKARHVENDPVRLVRRYSDARDRELVGFIASAFAYGNVKAVLHTVETIVSRLGSRPSEAVRAFDPEKDARQFRGFYHRFNTSRDLRVLLWILRRTLEEFGSLEGAFLAGMREDDEDVGAVLDRFCRTLVGFGHEQFYSRRDLAERAGVRFFFPRPSDGSACKRLNLFLRWMVRPDDGVDCGVWSRVSADRLVIPLDTHIARISQYIGLTSLRSPGWAMAVDITRHLRHLEPADPIRYDFALCHLGIAGDCPRKRNFDKCMRCPIQPVCLL